MNASMTGERLSAREEVIGYVSAIGLSLLSVTAMVLTGGALSGATALPLLAMFLVSFLSLRVSLAILMILLFWEHYTSIFTTCVVFAFVFGVSFLWRFRDKAWREFRNPLGFPLLLYGACVLPSFLNASRPWTSLYMLVFNVGAFIIVLFGLGASLRTYQSVRFVTIGYLTLTVANAVYIVALSLSGVARPFGLAGIFIVDFLGLGTCLAAAMAMVSHGLTRRLLVACSAFIAIALVLTQTRGVWLVSLFTLIVLVASGIVLAPLLDFSRRSLLATLVVGSCVVVGGGALVVALNPKIESRATELTDKSAYGINSQGYTQNSLITRVFIWSSAWSAFQAHPIVGVGVYSFRWSSREYTELSRTLYDRYVAKLSVHQTHLAVLAETGILGFVGFMVFVTTALRHGFRSVSALCDLRGRRYAFVAAVGLVYCIASMVITDAWLWGQQIVLLGMVMGCMTAISRPVWADEAMQP